VKTADVKIIQAVLNRNDFTHHGLHLNNSGKEKMAKLIGNNIKKLMSRKEETPFILKWEENQNTLLRKKVRKKLTNDITKDHNLKEVRTSKRQKRNPATRNENFLCITE